MNEEEYGRLIMRPLDTEPTTPGRVDIAKAVRDGRRGRRWQGWSAGVGVAAVIAVISTATASGILAAGSAGEPPTPRQTPSAGRSPAPWSSFETAPPVAPSTPAVPSGYANPPGPVVRPEPTGSSGGALPRDPALPSSCTVAGLPIGTATSAEVTGGDPTGTFLVGRTEPVAGGEMDVLVWRDGKLIDRIAQSGTPAAMTDINRSGLAVGGTDGYAPMPFFVSDGQVRRLHGGGRAVAVNDAGMIAGDHELNARMRPQRWSSTTADPQLMPLIDGATDGRVWDMNEDGTILVTLWSTAMSEQTYLWYADGSIQKVSPPTVSRKKQQRFEPGAFHYGWVYGEIVSYEGAMGQGVDRQIYRFEPTSGTWQAVNDPAKTGQVPTPTNALEYTHTQVSVVIGRNAYVLPPWSTRNPGVILNVVSEDARIVAGSTISPVSLVGQAIIWRCR